MLEIEIRKKQEDQLEQLKDQQINNPGLRYHVPHQILELKKKEEQLGQLVTYY